MISEELLIGKGISFGYGKMQTLSDVDIVLKKGGIVSVIGRNGAGKSTLLDVIMGVSRKWAGQVTLHGSDVSGKSAAEMFALGVAYMPQGGQLFNRMNIFDNLAFNPGNSTGITRKNIGAEVENILSVNAPGIWKIARDKILTHLSKPAAVLSGGERQILSLIRTLLTKKQVCLLDEPSIGLSHGLLEDLKELLMQEAKRGVSFVLVDQRVVWSLQCCNKVCILQRGRLIFEGEPEPLLKEKELLSSYLGLL